MFSAIHVVILAGKSQYLSSLFHKNNPMPVSGEGHISSNSSWVARTRICLRLQAWRKGALCKLINCFIFVDFLYFVGFKFREFVYINNSAS